MCKWYEEKQQEWKRNLLKQRKLFCLETLVLAIVGSVCVYRVVTNGSEWLSTPGLIAIACAGLFVYFLSQVIFSEDYYLKKDIARICAVPGWAALLDSELYNPPEYTVTLFPEDGKLYLTQHFMVRMTNNALPHYRVIALKDIKATQTYYNRRWGNLKSERRLYVVDMFDKNRKSICCLDVKGRAAYEEFAVNMELAAPHINWDQGKISIE